MSTQSSSKLMSCWYRSLAVFALVLYIIYTILSHCHFSSSLIFITKDESVSSQVSEYETNISHIVFGIASSTNTWKNRKPYIESWWKPNITRGFLFLDNPPNQYLPWPSTSPPYRVSEDTSRFKQYNKHKMPHAIRMARVILETFREENSGVKWYVMADDDTVLFVDNLVNVLTKYDHRKYLYIGTNSECVSSNLDNAFSMAFGGAGYALSYPLAEALATNLDFCIARYPTLFGSDHILQSCVADLGVSLTQENGFHQIDLHGDISGLLSAHPQSPALSLHHLDAVNPIFPWMNRYDGVNHLMKAARADASRLLQQTICYDEQRKWSFSISWGYSANIYEKFQAPSILTKPIMSFSSWNKRTAKLPYMFDTRFLSNDHPCEIPHVFYFHSVEKVNNNQLVTSYVVDSSRRLSSSSSSGVCSNHSDVSSVSNIRVFSAAMRHGGAGSRRECCDVQHVAGKNITEIKLRVCMKDELLS